MKNYDFAGADNELTRLRAQLAALIAERDKLRTVLERIANQFHNTQAEEYSEAGEMISIATVALESKSLGAHLPD